MKNFDVLIPCSIPLKEFANVEKIHPNCPLEDYPDVDAIRYACGATLMKDTPLSSEILHILSSKETS